jgi:hypothetical protein
MPHLILVSLELGFPPLPLLLAGQQQLLLQLGSQLSLIANYLRQQPLDGSTVMVEICDVSTVRLCVFAGVEL